MYAGTTIKIGDEEFVIPPISLGQLRNGLITKLQQHDELAAKNESLWELMQIRGEILLACLRRNYPNFPEEKLFAYLDLANTGPLWLSVLGASGFTPGEGGAVRAVESGT